MRHVSPRARALIAACFTAGGSLLVGAPEGAEGVGWVSVMIAAAGGIAVCCALGELGKKAPDRDFFSAVDSVAGRGAGAAGAVILGIMALIMLIRDLAVITQFVGANMMPETPRWLLSAAIVAAAAWCAAEGRSAVGRWTELAAAIAGIALSASLGFAVGDFDCGAVANGLRSYMNGTFGGAEELFCQSAGSVLLCAAIFFPFGSGERRRTAPLIAGTLIGCATLSLVMLFNVALLGADTLKLYNFPTYHALRVSGLRGVLERMEALLLLPAVATSFLRAAVEITFICGAVERLSTKLRGRKSPAFIVAVAGTAASVGLIPDQPVLAAFEAAGGAWYATVLAAAAVFIGAAALMHRT